MSNGRETLEAAAHWLGSQNEDLSEALSAEDGLRLYLYAQAHPELAEYCDGHFEGDGSDWTGRHFKAAIGRSNPWVKPRAKKAA